MVIRTKYGYSILGLLHIVHEELVEAEKMLNTAAFPRFAFRHSRVPALSFPAES